MADFAVHIRLQSAHRGRICQAMLLQLPDWFGRADAIDAYVQRAATLPMLVAMAGRKAAGFLSLRHSAGQSAEIVVMAVRPEWHRQGIGRALIREAVALARRQAARQIFVRTLGPSHPDPLYQRTRAFYRACGFRPAGETPDHWGPGVPSLLMIADPQKGL